MQISGSWQAELPVERLARAFAAEMIDQLNRAGFVPALADALARRQREPEAPGGFPVGETRHAGSEIYERDEPA